ncbi:MAG TPA: hypothetical protein V6C76_16795 [Drouetiella sp.]
MQSTLATPQSSGTKLPNHPSEERKQGLSNVAVFGILAAALLLCYLPVVVSNYGCADDFLWVASAMQHNFRKMQVLQMVQGRPMMAVLFTAGFTPMTGIDDLKFLRLFSILSIAGLAFTTYRTMIGAKFSKTASACVSLAMCLMPAFQVYVSWCATAFYATGCLVAGLALHLAERAYIQEQLSKKVRLAVASIATLLVATLIFQPGAMYYWVYAAILMFKPNTSLSDICKRFAWYSGLCVIALAMGFGMCSWGRNAFSEEMALPNQRTHLTHHLKEKIVWFFTQPLNACLSFSDLFPDGKAAIATAVALIAGVAAYLKDKLSSRMAKLAIAISIVPLSYLPNLAVEENWASFRTECALSSIIVLYSFFALLGLRQTLFKSVREPVFNALLIALAFTCGAAAFNNVYQYFVVPNTLEDGIIRAYINKDSHNRLTYKQVELNAGRLLTPGVAQEFGCPSSPIHFAKEPLEYIMRHSTP